MPFNKITILRSLWSTGTRLLDSTQFRLAAEMYERAYRLRGRMTSRQRLTLERVYYWFIGDGENALKTAHDMAQAYPNDWYSHNTLSFVLFQSGDYQAAVTEAREAIRLNPDATWAYRDLMQAQIALNRLTEAKKVFEEARLRQLDNGALRAQRYYIAFLERDSAGMNEHSAWISEHIEGTDPAAIVCDLQASLGLLKTARRCWDRAIERTIEAGQREPAAYLRLAAAWPEVEAGDSSRTKETTAAPSAQFGRQTRTMAGLLLARSGDLVAAQTVVQELSKEAPSKFNDNWASIHAAIAIQQNRPVEAIRILASAGDGVPDFPIYLRGLAYLEGQRPQEASADFRKLLDYPKVLRDSPSIVLALAQVQLARALVMMGDKEAARKSYLDFLRLWKDADPDIPIYKQAKAEYGKLR